MKKTKTRDKMRLTAVGTRKLGITGQSPDKTGRVIAVGGFNGRLFPLNCPKKPTIFFF